MKRHKVQKVCLQSVLLRSETGVADAMPAFVEIKRCLSRLPAWIPRDISVLNVVIFSIRVQRHAVVAVPGDPEHFCILVEAVSAAGIRYDREEVIAAKIVDPGKWCPGSRDDIFEGLVIKITIFHRSLLLIKDERTFGKTIK